MGRNLKALGLGIATLIAAGCGAFFPTPPGSPGFGETIDVVNQPTLDIAIVVNGKAVADIRPHGSGTVPPPALPPKPWAVAAVSPSRREILRFEVQPGQVWSTTSPDGSTTMRGAGERVDLSCGRLDVTVGAMMIGPAPAPDAGAPGDCDP